MKTIIKIFLLFSVATTWLSCERIDEVSPPSLTPSASSLNFTGHKGCQIVKIDATRRWTATASDFWITVTPDYYPGSGTHFEANVSVSVLANENKFPRSGSITFVLDGKETIKLPVQQEGKGDSPLPPLPENCLMRINFDDLLVVESPYEFTITKSDASTPIFVNGFIKQAYQASATSALIVTPGAKALDALKGMNSFTYTVWIKYKFDNSDISNLLALSSPNKEIGNISLNIEKGPNSEGTYPFKAFINTDNVPWDIWLDFPKVSASAKDEWTQLGLVYDAHDGRFAMYQNGVTLGQWTTGQPGLQFNSIGAFVFGAFPTMVGLSSAGSNHWTSSGSFYTGLFDDIYFYTIALTDSDMREQYEVQVNF